MKQLTAAARQELNALIAEGVPVAEALSRLRARPDAFEEASTDRQRTLKGRAAATSTQEVDEYFATLAERLARVGVVRAGQAVPIRDAELAKFQRTTTLPYAYVAFLRRYGGARCRLWSHDHHAVESAHLTALQRKARAHAERQGKPIPERGFVILGHLGAWYFALHGAGGIDEVVHLVHADDPAQTGPWFGSVLGWIDTLAEDAVKAWQRSPFEGTTA